MLADILWEKAMKLADVIAPEHPLGTLQMEPAEQWQFLEAVAMELSPTYWDDPDAIKSLYDLRKRFAPQLATPALAKLAQAQAKIQQVAPDLAVTPENPKFDRKMSDLGIREDVTKPTARVVERGPGVVNPRRIAGARLSA